MNKHYTLQEYIEKFSSIQDSYDYYFEQQKEIERLNNIIKEVREYIESYMPNYDFDKTNLIKLLEILQGSDKVE